MLFIDTLIKGRPVKLSARQSSMKKVVFIIFWLFPAIGLGGNNQSDQLWSHQRRLEKLRREIDAVEKLVVEASLREQALSDLLANLDRKLSLRKQLLRELVRSRKTIERELDNAWRQLRRVRTDIGRAEGDIAALERDITSLRALVAKRAVYAYKRWRWDELRLILAAENFNQALTRKKYFNIIAMRDHRNLEILKEKTELLSQYKSEKVSSEKKLTAVKKKITRRLAQKNRVITEEKKEESTLTRERQSKSDLLVKIKQDRSELLKELEAKKEAALEIERMIVSLEKRKDTAREVAVLFPDLEFSKLRGRMGWPASGKVVAKFGNQLNPKLKTWTENTGIDIKAPPGSPVYSVAAGKVTVVTWMRGYGSTLIISHPGGYYTVYTHLDEILVNAGSIVKGGTKIATVGDSGSLEGSRLHFELWERKLKHDPEKWLKKRG